MTDESRLNLEDVRHLYSSVGKLITSAESVDAVLEKLMDEVEKFFKPENWSLLRLDPISEELFFVIVKGISSEDVKGIRLKLGEGIAGSVAAKGESIFVENADQDERVSKKVDEASGFTTKSIMAVPVKFQDNVYGVIELINRVDGDLFRQDELFVLETIGDFAAIAFVNAMRYENAIETSRIDPLTGGYNRIKLDELVAEWECPQYRRKSDDSSFMCVAVIDVNDFKIINDSQGHRAGDNILRETAKDLLHMMRDEDYFFRIGGDEFLLIVLHAAPDDPEEVESQILTRLGKLSEASANPAGFSFGVATGKRQDVRELMHNADLKMYDYKKALKLKRQSD